MIGAEGVALDLSPYLEHVERRVLGGIRLSEIDLGRGGSANRNTAQTITQTLIDACTEIQRVVEDALNWKLFFFLLQEGGFNVRGDNLDEDMVYLDFPPIDTEEKRAKENHEMALYHGGLTDSDEARLRIGMDPIKPEQDQRMFLVRHEIALIEAKADADERVGKAVAAAKPKTKTTASKNATANLNQPVNQFGVSPAAPRIALNAQDQSVDAFVLGVCDQWAQGHNIGADHIAIHDIYNIGYAAGKGVDSTDPAVTVSGFFAFLNTKAAISLKDAATRGMTIIDNSGQLSPNMQQIRMETANTLVSSTARFIAICAYVTGFAHGATDASKAGIVRVDGEEKKALTFPVDARDLVYPGDIYCPTLQVLEA
jgi:hypothetical protein